MRIKFESGMIVTLLAAPRLAEPLAHELFRQLLCHGPPHTHDPVAQHFADGLVLPEPAHLTEHSRPHLEQGPSLLRVHRQPLRCLTYTWRPLPPSLSVATCNQTSNVFESALLSPNPGLASLRKNVLSEEKNKGFFIPSTSSHTREHC